MFHGLAGRGLRQSGSASSAVCVARATARASATGGGLSEARAQAQAICNALSGRGSVAEVSCKINLSYSSLSTRTLDHAVVAVPEDAVEAFSRLFFSTHACIWDPAN
jgi:hypothetical protein